MGPSCTLLYLKKRSLEKLDSVCNSARYIVGDADPSRNESSVCCWEMFLVVEVLYWRAAYFRLGEIFRLGMMSGYTKTSLSVCTCKSSRCCVVFPSRECCIIYTKCDNVLYLLIFTLLPGAPKRAPQKCVSVVHRATLASVMEKTIYLDKCAMVNILV